MNLENKKLVKYANSQTRDLNLNKSYKDLFGIQNEHFMTLQSTLYELCQNNLFCDATIRLDDGGVIPIHRVIMSACSEYFRTLFTTRLYEHEKIDVSVPGVKTEIMKLLVKYAYLRRLEVDSENVCELVEAANYLWIFGVLDICRFHLKNNLTPENCIGILKLAKLHYFCQDLKEDTYLFIIGYFEEVAKKNKDILELPVDELCDLVSADELNVKNEEVVWELVLKWIDYDSEHRKQHISELMRAVRLGLLSTKYFLEKVKEHPYVAGVQSCRPIVVEALTFFYNLELTTGKNNELRTPDLARPRIPHELLFIFGGWCGDKKNLVEVYDTRADRWIPQMDVDFNEIRVYHKIGVIDFNIYVIGGYDGHEYFNTCRCFNAVTKKWREVAPMSSKRCHLSVAVHNDIIYAIGGFDGVNRLKTAECYNYLENQWSKIAPMIMQRSDASAATLNNKIYIAGGFNGNECIRSAEFYNPETNQWTLIPSMRFRRCGFSAIAYHGCFYVLGGFDGTLRLNSCEKYNPETNTWSHIADMYTQRSNFGAAVIDDMIFAIGGFNDRVNIFYVECYDDQTNKWYRVAKMSTNRSGLAACVLTGLPNVYDYIYDKTEKENLKKIKK